MKTSDKLADALTAANAPITMIVRARQGYYDDYESPLPFPLMQLVQDCNVAGLLEIAERVKDGDFDGTKEESEAWAASPEGQETFSEFFKGFQHDHDKNQ